MNLLIGVALSLFSLIFIFNVSVGELDIVLRWVGTMMLFTGTMLIYTSKELK